MNKLGDLPIGAEYDNRAPYNETDEEIECSQCKELAMYVHPVWEHTPLDTPIQVNYYYCRKHFLELYADFIMDCGHNVSEEEFMREEGIELL